MPIYAYKCTNCGHQEEKIEPMSAPKEQLCMACEEENGLKRVPTSANFVIVAHI